MGWIKPIFDRERILGFNVPVLYEDIFKNPTAIDVELIVGNRNRRDA